MGLPTLIKTWQISANNVTASQAEGDYYPKVLFNIKQTLTGFASNPWTVVGSSDGTTANTSDNWGDYTDVVWSTGSHSWIVLQNSTGIQIMFDCDYSVSNVEDLNILISLQGVYTGFTSTSVRPTATDEDNLKTGHATSWFADQTVTPSQGVMHAWHSTDGLITRIVLMHTNTCRAIFSLEPIRNPAVGHTDPYVYGWYTTATPGGDVATIPIGEDLGYCKTTHSGSAYTVRYTGEGLTNSNLLETSSFAQVDDISGELGMSEIGLYCSEVGARGSRGATSDIWWGPYQVAGTGDTFPANASTRSFIQLGVYVFPWTGDGTVPVTV